MGIYYLDLQVSGDADLPENQPVIYASNHPNSLMDTMVLGSQVARPIQYLARSGLFSNPIAGWLLRSAGAIPVYRRQDGPATPGGNEGAFAAAYQVLRNGGVIGIFPEGQNSPLRHIQDIKTGVARIALGAEAGVKIVPVGLNYEERERFLTRVLVRFGDPIDADAFYQEDGRAAARELTDVVQQRMREVAVHVQQQGYTQLVQDIDALYGEQLQEELLGQVDVRGVDEKLIRFATSRVDQGRDLEGAFTVKQWIADAVEHYQDADPGAVNDLERQIDRYKTHLNQLRLREDFADRPATTVSVRQEAIKLMLYAVLLAPIAFWGLVHNFVPFRLSRRYALGAPEDAIYAFRAVTGGIVFFGASYGIYAASLWAGLGHWWSVVGYLSSLPICGFFFLRYRARLTTFRDRIALRTLFQTKRHLLRGLLLERTQLIARIDSLRRTYEEIRRAEPEPNNGPEAARQPPSLAEL